MNQMRRDPITRKWVIVDRSFGADEAIQRLRSAVRQEHKRRRQDQPCDFCPQNESKTPASILEMVGDQMRYRTSSPDWRIRVVPNRNPVFRIEGNLNRRLIAAYVVMDAIGAHEVIVEHRQHVDWDEIPIEDVAAILSIYRERIVDLSRDERFGHIFIFKNYGPTSNSKIPHPHSILTASPAVPERIRRELHYTRRHYEMKERCLFCDIITEESRQKNPHAGLVRKSENFITISPFFAAHPFETWILPRRHNSNYRNLEPRLFLELAQALRENLRVIKEIVGPLSYTLLLFTRPNKIWGEERDYWTTIDEDYHWHFKFFPRFPRQVGFHRSFSAGSGYMVNQIPPETAAELMRSKL